MTMPNITAAGRMAPARAGLLLACAADAAAAGVWLNGQAR